MIKLILSFVFCALLACCLFAASLETYALLSPEFERIDYCGCDVFLASNYQEFSRENVEILLSLLLRQWLLLLLLFVAAFCFLCIAWLYQYINAAYQEYEKNGRR